MAMGSDAHPAKSVNAEIAESAEDTEKNQARFHKRSGACTQVFSFPLCALCVERFCGAGLRQRL
jgi:hypothetical protein